MSPENATTARQRNVWVFNGGNTFSGNPKWLFLHIAENRPDIEPWWICDSAATVELVRGLGYNAVKFGTPKGNAVQRRAGTFVVNQVKEHIAVNLEGANLLNLWHGVGVKNIERGITEGYLSEKIARKYIKYNQVYRSSQQFLVTSPAMETHFRKEVGLDDHNVVRGPYPQNVVPSTLLGFSSYDHDIRSRAGAPADARIAVYAPTPRRTGSDTFLGCALPNVPALIDALERSNTLLVLKMHPHMSTDAAFVALRERFGDSPYLYFWDNDDDVYEIFGDVDLAVVDYSSILYDMLAAGVKNVIRYAFDLEDGDNDVLQEGMDYLDLSAGTLATDFEQLLEAFGASNAVPQAELSRLNTFFWDYADSRSVDEIIDAALAFEPVPVELPTLHTFDVFDTVFGRDVIEPLGIFEAIRDRAIERNLDLPRHVRARFVEVRRTAESACRENRRKRPELQESKDFEITLADVYDKIQEVYGVSDASRETLELWEQELEIGHVRPLQGQIAKVLELLDAGEDVHFISDMYLPQDTVRAMLVAAEPRFADVPLHLSSTVGVQKSTKALYLHVYRELRYDYARWIHTGDNPHADQKMPAQLGITTRKLRTPTFDDYERQIQREVVGADGYRLASMLFERRHGQRNRYEDMFMFRHVALWLVPYIDWVLDDAVHRGYETLYFVSRDGHHMKRIADVLIEERGLPLTTRYIYGSRVSWRFAAMVDGVPDEVFGAFGSFAGARSIPALAKAARISEGRLLELVPAAAPFGTEPLNKTQHAAVLGAMRQSSALRDHLMEIGRSDRALLQEYMRQNVDFDKPHAYVEYWGRGYTQDCLARVLTDLHGEPRPLPFYYARSIYSSDAISVRHDFTTQGFSMLGVEAVFANLPHGTVQGFREGEDGTIEPVVEARPFDEEIFQAAQSQLPAFARDFARTPFHDLDAVRREAFRFGLQHFGRNPGNRVYAHHIGRLQDAVELGASERPFAPALTWKDFLRLATGTPQTRVTRNMAMSLSRSGNAQRTAFRLIQKYNVLGRAKKVRSLGAKRLRQVKRKLGR